jgi:uncharacterized protein (DUF58 family)
VVEGFWSGLHRSPHHGFSVEFTEYRPYSPGDDPRYLDWRVFARSDRFYLKRFEDETNLRCHLLVDCSRSMDFGSLPYTKADYARTFAATLAWFLNAQGDAVGLLTFAEKVLNYLPARHRRGHLRQLLLALEPGLPHRSATQAGSAAGQTSLNEPLERVAELARKRGMIVMLSDLLAPVADLEQNLGMLTAAGHEVILFQLLDPKELVFDFDRPMLFQDMENGRDLYLDPHAFRSTYQNALDAHFNKVQGVCRELGAAFHRLATNRPLELALLDFLRSRGRRNKTVRRAQTAIFT